MRSLLIRLVDREQPCPELLKEYSWTAEDWSAFYVTCIYCLHQYLEKGLVPFDDRVLHDRQLLVAAGHDESLL